MDKNMSFAFAGVSKKHEVQESIIDNIETSTLTLEAKEDEVGDNSVTAESTTYTVVTNCSTSSIIGEKGSDINVNIIGNSYNYQEREENTNVDSCVDFSDETDINPVRTLFENSPIMEKVQEFSSDLTSVAEDEEDHSYEKSGPRGNEILFLTQDDSLQIGGFSESDDCNNSKAAMTFCNTPNTPNKLVQLENPRSPDQDAMDREMECLLSSRDDDERSLDAEELVGTLCTTSVDQSNGNVNVQAFSQKDNNCLQPSETASFEGEVNSWFETLSGLLRPNDYWEDVKAKMKSQGLKEENHIFFLGLESDPSKQASLFVLSDQELKILSNERLSGKCHEKNFIERSSLKRANHDSQFLDQKRQCHGTSDRVDEACSPLEFDAASKPVQSIGDALQESLYVMQASYKPKSALQFDVEGDSKYNTQVNEILKFLGNALDNVNGKYQDNSNNTLYVCGSPGVGKTTAVNWCCDRLQGPSTQICRINSASYRDMRFFLADIFENLGIRMKNPSIKGLGEIMKKRCMSVVLVIDEIDSLISTKGISSLNSQSEKLLQELCATVKETSSKIVLIGISNAVESNEAKKLKALGLVRFMLCFTKT
jgi:ATPase family associated with various cellular activities (AAA)